MVGWLKHESDDYQVSVLTPFNQQAASATNYRLQTILKVGNYWPWTILKAHCGAKSDF